MFLLKKVNHFLLLVLLYAGQTASARQQPYWQQQVDYRIEVSLNDQQHSLDGNIEILYRNQSPDTLTYIWFHLWPNAYKNDRTAFTDQMLENGNTSFYFSDEDAKGYINRLNFQVDGITAELEDHPTHIDIARLILPQPLMPGATVNIQSNFHVQLPEIFSRSGHRGQHYQVAQWYPKPAVYDQQGWHPFPYLDQGEFYGEFGSFDVNITLPANYVVAAPGTLHNADEKKWLESRANYAFEPLKKRVKTKGGSYKTITEEFPATETRTKTLHYTLDQAHDFAWFADKRFAVQKGEARLNSGKTVEISSYFIKDQEEWKETVDYASKAIIQRSAWIGDYPYASFSIVQSDSPTGGGMEYPGITLISSGLESKLLEYTIAHEAGHNWFQAALGSNERSTPWLDEGINSYYDNRYSHQIDSVGELDIFSRRIRIQHATELLVENAEQSGTAQAMGLSGEQYSQLNYNLMVYTKTAQWLKSIEDSIGKDKFDRAMQLYYDRWKFRHPNENDFRQVLEEVSGQSLNTVFSKLQDPNASFFPKREGFRIAFPFSGSNLKETLQGKSLHTLLVSPAVGYNMYDGFMVGGLLSNITLPVPKLQYLFAPMYATRSKSLAGLALINYSHYPKSGIWHRLDFGISGSRFHTNQFTDPDGKDLNFQMSKLVPGLRLTLREKSARSTRERFVQFKSYWINEQSLRFGRDTVIVGSDTSLVDRYDKVGEDRTLNQLKLVWQDFRVLYPYRAELKLEQGRDFVRAAFTGNYFFNYADQGGLNFRVFAGKFFYTSAKTFTKQFETDRYHLNMTGANGYEDYTYSDYFVGRNEFDGWASQQIMERDGGFKTRTDLLASKVGRSDDWLIALNFSSSIPDRMNPLSLLPFKIPLKIFADIGTYAGAWDRDANTDRFLFDAGLQLSLLKETVHIYLPLLYSAPFKEYIQSTIPKKERLLRKISFSIDLSNFQFRKLNRNLGF